MTKQHDFIVFKTLTVSYFNFNTSFLYFIRTFAA